MKIASFINAGGAPTYGVVAQDGLHEADEGLRRDFPDLRSLLAAGETERLRREHSPRASSIEAAKLLAPVPNPDKIICIGLNYMTHIRETGREAPQHPSIFTRYPSSVVGHAQPLVRPKASTWFDFEGELAFVIGRNGRAISRERAMEHVAGYTCFNDGSVRDFQRHTTQFWAGKNFDRSGSAGPWLVTADEIADPAALHMETRLNGETVQSTSIADLAFDIPALVAYLSTVVTLLPGDVIATGTPSGVGLFREPKLFMKAGDRVEVEISGIGVLANRIEDED